jgi:hypothetical protein
VIGSAFCFWAHSAKLNKLKKRITGRSLFTGPPGIFLTSKFREHQGLTEISKSASWGNVMQALNYFQK